MQLAINIDNILHLTLITTFGLIKLKVKGECPFKINRPNPSTSRIASTTPCPSHPALTMSSDVSREAFFASLATVRETLKDLDIGLVPSGDDDSSEGASQFLSQMIRSWDECNIYGIPNSSRIDDLDEEGCSDATDSGSLGDAIKNSRGHITPHAMMHNMHRIYMCLPLSLPHPSHHQCPPQ